MAIQQATKYSATAKLLSGDTTELNSIMPSNQNYVTKAANGTVSLDTPLSDALRGANPQAEHSLVWGTGDWRTSYFLPSKSIKGGMTDGYGAATSEFGYSDFKLVDKNGNAKPLILDVRTKSGTTDNFTIYFDRGWGVYATRIEVDGKVYFDNNFVFTYKGDAQKSQFSVKITHISQAKYPIVLLAILSGLAITFDRWSGLNNFSISNRNTFDARTIAEWGIVTQQGRMEIGDIDGEIQQLQEMGILQNEQPMIVKMSYINPTSGAEEWKTIGDYYSRFDYTFGVKEVPIEMHGKAEDWQNILYAGRVLTENVSAYDLLQELRTLANSTFSISTLATNFLKSINIKYCYLESGGTLFEAINKVLYIGMCVLWESEDGNNIFVDLYNGRRYVKGVSPVYRLNKTRTYGNLQGQYNDVVKGVEIKQNIVFPKTLRMPLPGAEWQASAYSKDAELLVVVAPNTVAYSSDGKSFTNGIIPAGDWSGVAYGNGIWVAVGRSATELAGAIARSEDGKTFTKINHADASRWDDVVYVESQKLFVLVGFEGVTAYSSDGKSFTNGYIPMGNWIKLAYGELRNGDKRVVALSSSGQIAYSDTGKTFNYTMTLSGVYRDITFGNGLFVMVGDNRAAYSNDGRTFYSGGDIPSGYWYSVVSNNEMFVAVGQNNIGKGIVAYSLDGSNFESGIIPDSSWRLVEFIDTLFVAISAGVNLSISTNGNLFVNLVVDSIGTNILIYPQNSTNRVAPFQINELLQLDTTISTVPIAQVLAENIVSTENGKQALEITIQKIDLYVYDRNGNQTGQKITAINGETLKVGNFVEVWDDRKDLPFIRDKTGDTKVFEVRGVSKARSGDPLKITLQLREV